MQAKVLRNTIAKQSTVQAKELAPQFKIELEPGTYPITKWEYTAAGHQKVTFTEKIGNYQTWIIWGDDIECEGEGKQIHLKVPYYSQRDNRVGPGYTCSTSTHAMLLNFLKPGSVASDDEYFRKFVGTSANSVNWNIHTAALQKFGIQSVFREDLDFEHLVRSLELGFPIAIGVLHKGSVESPDPNNGHVLLIVGVNKAKGVFYANDPWGKGFDYSNSKGQDVEYPIHPSLERRWLADGAGSGWGRLIKAIDGKATGLV